jgi:hypothetical protein
VDNGRPLNPSTVDLYFILKEIEDERRQGSYLRYQDLTQVELTEKKEPSYSNSSGNFGCCESG